MDADAIGAGLRSATLATVAQAEAAGGVPTAPGFYCWWATRAVLPAVPITRAGHGRFGPLYVGIAPASQSSSATLRSRVCRQHIAGNVNASTFRFGLAALLWQQMGWLPARTNSGKIRLTPEDNTALSNWQSEYLGITWLAVDEPWLYEREVVAILGPPMNREHNHAHPFYETMGAVRMAFRAAAIP